MLFKRKKKVKVKRKPPDKIQNLEKYLRSILGEVQNEKEAAKNDSKRT